MARVANLVFNSFINDSRVLKESISLANNGFDVEIIAHLDKGLKAYEEKNNFQIKRFSYLDRKVTKSKIKKLYAYIRYVSSCVKHCHTYNILHCNDLNTLPIGYLIKKFYNKDVKIVYDAHEYETEINGLNGIKKRMMKVLEKYLIEYADKVICVSDSIANEYVKLYNISKPALILNTPSYVKMEKKDIFRKTLNISKDKNIFLYQGGFSIGRGIEILIETFKNVNDKNVIVFMGYGPLEEMVIIASEKYGNIYFHQAVTPDKLLEYTCSADFGILFYENNCLNHYFCSPNKMFEYLMAEIPVIVSNLYEMKRLVENHDIGIVAKENSVKGLQKAITKISTLNREEIHTNILKIKELYNWEEQEKVLLSLYEELSK